MGEAYAWAIYFNMLQILKDMVKPAVIYKECPPCTECGEVNNAPLIDLSILNGSGGNPVAFTIPTLASYMGHCALIEHLSPVGNGMMYVEAITP